jgi:polysaccharide biosynthesis protein PslG
LRTFRTVALVVLAGLLAACSGGDGGSSAGEHPSTTTAPPGQPRHFTATESRAGFAHGYEMVRRDPPAAVEADLDLMASTGARWFRAGIGWGSIETSPGVYRWEGTDRIVRGARARGMSVVAVIASAPGWDSAPACRTYECAPDDPGPYARFAAVAARRYASLGVHHWEIWNEPNHAAFWGPRPDPRAYTELLRLSAAAIRAVDPEAVILTGGLAPGPDAGADISPLTFLRRIYDRGGRSSFNAVAHHPYQFPSLPTAPDLTNAFLQTELLHEVMVRHGDGDKRIWGTEVGAPTRGQDSVSEDDQSEWVRDYYRVWDRWKFTGPLLWYTARDHGNADDLEDSFGLVHHNRTPKPALATFLAVMRGRD